MREGGEEPGQKRGLRQREPDQRRPADARVASTHLRDKLVVRGAAAAHRREVAREVGVAIGCAVGHEQDAGSHAATAAVV